MLAECRVQIQRDVSLPHALPPELLQSGGGAQAFYDLSMINSVSHRFTTQGTLHTTSLNQSPIKFVPIPVYSNLEFPTLIRKSALINSCLLFNWGHIYLKGSSPQNQKYILFLLNLVLFISLDCFGVSCLVLEISAVEISQIYWD